MDHLKISASLMAERLRVFKTLAIQAKERGEVTITLHVDEVWDANDEAALQAFEVAVAELTGAQRLPMDAICTIRTVAHRVGREPIQGPLRGPLR